MEVVAADVRNYLHRLMDDDFTVNLNSNEEKRAKRVSEDHSKRVHWITTLPMRLQFPREVFEVAIIAVQIKNVQMNAPFTWIGDGGGDDVTAGDIPPMRVERFADLFPYLLPMVEIEPDFELWIVEKSSFDQSFFFRDMKEAVKKAYKNVKDDDSRLLNDVTKELSDSLPSGSQSNRQGYASYASAITNDLVKLGERGFTRLYKYDTANIRWKTGDRNFGPGRFSVGYQVGLLMSEDTAHFLRLRNQNEWLSQYKVGMGEAYSTLFGNVTNTSKGKKYYYVARTANNSTINLTTISSSTKPGARSSWQPTLPLRMSFESGGTSDPSSSKKITLSVAPGKTLKFTALDPKTNQTGFFTFKKGTIFEGKPSEFYEFLSTSIVGQYDFLTPDVGSVDIYVEGLAYNTGPYTASSGQDNQLLVTNLSLSGPLVHYVPPPRARNYRVLEYNNTEELTVKIVDSLRPERFPRFHVGITDITLHFREVWNSPFRV